MSSRGGKPDPDPAGAGNFRRRPSSHPQATLEDFIAGKVFQPSGKEDEMAGVDVGVQGGRKRATNSDINMIPFIDLLMVTIAFLLITAVWVTNSRINADAQVPGTETCRDDCATLTDKVLHLNIGESDFSLTWKQAGTVVTDVRVPSSRPEIGTTSRARWSVSRNRQANSRIYQRGPTDPAIGADKPMADNAP